MSELTESDKDILAEDGHGWAVEEIERLSQYACQCEASVHSTQEELGRLQGLYAEQEEKIDILSVLVERLAGALNEYFRYDGSRGLYDARGCIDAREKGEKLIKAVRESYESPLPSFADIESPKDVRI